MEIVRENSNEYMPQQNDGYHTNPNSNDWRLSTHCWGDTKGTPEAHLPLEIFSNTNVCIEVVLKPRPVSLSGSLMASTNRRNCERSLDKEFGPSDG